MNFLSELAEIAGQKSAVVPEKTSVGTDVFKKLKIDPNQTLGHRDAVGIIQQGEEDSEAEETVAFGLELDDGSIVKVYIKPDEADDFEKTMSDYLGKEDDVEKAIDDLADKFDIVSVEWPAGKNPDNEESPGEVNPEEVTPDGVPGIDPQDGEKIKLGFSLLDKPKKDDAEKDPEDDAEKDDAEKDPEDDAEKEDPEEDPDGEDLGDKDSEDDNLEDKDSEEDDSEEDDDLEKDPDKKKKKKKSKKSSDDLEEGYRPGANIKSRFISEKKDDSIKLEHIFKSSLQRNIFKLIMLLDFPVERLLLNKSITKNSIRNKSLEMSSNNRAKTLIHRLIRELSLVSDDAFEKEKERAFTSKHTVKDLEESQSLEDVLTNKTQLLILDILKALGVPEYVLSQRTNLLKQHLKRISKIVSRHTRIKNYLYKLAEVLNIHQEVEKEVKKEKLKEDVDFGTDKYLILVSKLLSRLGVPDENLTYQKSSLLASLRTKEKTINRSQVATRLLVLIKLLGDQEPTNEELTLSEIHENLKDEAADLGEWGIAQLGDRGLVLSIEHISIKMSMKESDRFLEAINEGHAITIKSSMDHYHFIPVHNGREYVVSSENGTLESSILLPKKTIENLVDL